MNLNYATAASMYSKVPNYSMHTQFNNRKQAQRERALGDYKRAQENMCDDKQYACYLGWWERQVIGAYWPGSLVEIASSSQAQQNILSEKVGGEVIEEDIPVSSGLPPQAHTNMGMEDSPYTSKLLALFCCAS